MLTQDRLRARVRYCEESGSFFWVSGRKAGGKVGDSVSRGHRRFCIDGKTYWAHRLAWFYVHGVWPEFVDHRNGDGLDNRIGNLRGCSRTENARNRKTHSNSALGLKGVHALPSGRYKANIWLGRKNIALGMFDTPQAAAAARIKATLDLHGEFARIA